MNIKIVNGHFNNHDIKSISDDEIMLLVKSGEIELLRELYRRHHVRVFQFFLRRTSLKDLSQDLMQDVFIRIVHYKHNFNTQFGGFVPWMFKIAMNLLADHHKNEQRRTHLYKDFEMLNTHCGLETNQFPDEYIDMLNSAIGQLSDEEREIVWLCRFEKLSYQQIADMHSVSLSVIKNRIHRAIKKVKAIFLESAQNNSYGM